MLTYLQSQNFGRGSPYFTKQCLDLELRRSKGEMVEECVFLKQNNKLRGFSLWLSVSSYWLLAIIF